MSAGEYNARSATRIPAPWNTPSIGKLGFQRWYGASCSAHAWLITCFVPDRRGSRLEAFLAAARSSSVLLHWQYSLPAASA
jgi:hypothetical protein